MQLAPAARDAPQALVPVVMVKSLGLGPTMLGTMPVTAVAPLLVMVAARAAEVVFAVVFGKIKIEVRETELAGGIPVPTSVVVCGELVALSATESAAEKPDATDGVKVM